LKKEKESDYILEMLEARFEIAKLKWEASKDPEIPEI